jgi:hypothetical protein
MIMLRLDLSSLKPQQELHKGAVWDIGAIGIA